MGVEELSKPIGSWCSHWRHATGCSIHGAHPASCRSFACEWLRNPRLAHRYRPDLTKVVLTEHDSRLMANCDPANPTAWRRKPIYPLLKEEARARWPSGRTVIARAGRHWWLIAPDEDIDLGEVDPETPLQIQQARPGGPISVKALAPVPETKDDVPAVSPG